MAADAHPVPTEQLDEQTLLKRIEDLVPKLRERALEAEDLRQIPQQTLDDVWATGYLSAFRTRHFGGPGLGLSALANGARILAQGCASTAWRSSWAANAPGCRPVRSAGWVWRSQFRGATRCRPGPTGTPA